MKLILFVGVAAVLAGCASGNCRKHQAETKAEAAAATTETKATKNPEAPMAKVTDRIRVFKYDGSLQCNQGKAISLETMQKELKGIEVFSSENKPDSLMRIQQCGTPTGRANVFEIARENLDAAKKLGFQLWTFD
ncbi:MAG: hypothetical protein KF767_16045 [Bdellovibrionaceae bacterium]|nr:hypothetical protein [Pseudobdellovibrionaceae bacterium]